jgi:hypothetical protein
MFVNLSSFTAMRVFVLLFLTLYAICENNPSVKISITQSATNALAAKFIPVAKELLSALKVPDHNRVVKTPAGNVDVNLTSIVLESFHFNEPKIRFLTDSILLEVASASTSLKFNWGYKGHGLLPIDDHGTATSSLSLSVLAEAKIQIENNRPTLNVVKTDAPVQKFDVKLTGGDSAVFNAIIDIFNSQIKKVVQQVVNIHIHKVFLGYIKSFLAAHEFKQQLLPNLAVDYSIASLNIVNDKRIVMGSVASFLSRGKPYQAEIAIKIPDTVVTDNSMIQVVVSKNALNGAAWAGHDSGAFQITITNKEIPSSFPFQLKTKHMGLVIGDLASKYPDNDMEVEVRTSKPPVMQVSNNGCQMLVVLEIEFKVKTGSSTVSAFTATTQADFSVALQLEQSAGKAYIKGKTKLNKLDIDVKSSSIGMLKRAMMTAAVSPLVDMFVIPLVNRALKSGIPIQIHEAISLKNPRVSYYDNYVGFYSDFDIDPRKIKM